MQVEKKHRPWTRQIRLHCTSNYPHYAMYCHSVGPDQSEPTAVEALVVRRRILKNLTIMEAGAGGGGVGAGESGSGGGGASSDEGGNACCPRITSLMHFYGAPIT